jgi:hypothetical protein
VKRVAGRAWRCPVRHGVRVARTRVAEAHDFGMAMFTTLLTPTRCGVHIPSRRVLTPPPV